MSGRPSSWPNRERRRLQCRGGAPLVLWLPKTLRPTTTPASNLPTIGSCGRARSCRVRSVDSSAPFVGSADGLEASPRRQRGGAASRPAVTDAVAGPARSLSAQTDHPAAGPCVIAGRRNRSSPAAKPDDRSRGKRLPATAGASPDRTTAMWPKEWSAASTRQSRSDRPAFFLRCLRLAAGRLHLSGRGVGLEHQGARSVSRTASLTPVGHQTSGCSSVRFIAAAPISIA
jgi:hypothetical protein